jgi:hypothetical protein
MHLALVDRPPSTAEVERFRLLLSTYQDGSGMLAQKHGRTLPGWRDFERAVAVAFNGENQENKFIFDVLITDPNKPVKYGISCKMRSELRRIDRDGRVTIELSNSSKKFNDYLTSKGIKTREYKSRADEVGKCLVELVEEWKLAVSIERGGNVDVGKSYYLTLMYDKTGFYQLHWLTLSLPDPAQINWYYPKTNKKGKKKIAGHLNGDDKNQGRVFEWYGDSGGQLKYYPLAQDALWTSPRFCLEPLPATINKLGLLWKAKDYFPEQWDRLIGSIPSTE